MAASTLQYRFDFLKYRFVCGMVSLLLLGAGVVLYVMRGGFLYNIEFTGGTEVRLAFEKPVDIADIRSALGGYESVIQSVGSANKDFIVRVSNFNATSFEDEITKTLQKSFADNPVTINGIEWVGPEVGRETQWNTIIAVLLSMLALLVYVAIRSDFKYGLGAVLALLHDVLVILVFLLATGEAFSLNILAAILAVIGYSLNDTIVIFSRIKENVKLLKNHSKYDIVNLSINQTLSRTILTSAATFVSLLALLLIGGETLRGLSLVMSLGVIVGTYSSVYIASAIMLAVGSFHERQGMTRSA